MPNIKEITGRIASVNATQQITKAMKMVAAAKLAKSQTRLLQFRPYAHALAEILTQVMASIDADDACLQPWLHQRPVKKMLLVIISSDKGLCGSFNANVVKKTLAAIRRFPYLTEDDIDLLVIGKKAWAVFQKYEYKIIDAYHSLSSQLTDEGAVEAVNFITHAFMGKQYDQVDLIYNVWGSLASQEVTIEQFLPFLYPVNKVGRETDFIYEPSPSFLVEQFIPKHLASQLYNAILSSQVAEHATRMANMSKATDNANNLLKSLRITYNKTRQAAITNEILEIAAGAESLRG